LDTLVFIFLPAIALINYLFYEQTKDMTRGERVAYFKSLAAAVHKEHGLHTLNEIRADEQTKRGAVLS
jgi:hypothetical protein